MNPDKNRLGRAIAFLVLITAVVGVRRLSGAAMCPFGFLCGERSGASMSITTKVELGPAAKAPVKPAPQAVAKLAPKPVVKPAPKPVVAAPPSLPAPAQAEPAPAPAAEPPPSVPPQAAPEPAKAN